MADLHNAVGYSILLLAVWVAAPPVVSFRKGYASRPWFSAVGIIGVAMLAFFPILDRGEPETDRRRLRAIADKVGWGLSAIGVVAWLGYCVVWPGA